MYLPVPGHSEPVLGLHPLASVGHERRGARQRAADGLAHAQAQVQRRVVAGPRGPGDQL